MTRYLCCVLLLVSALGCDVGDDAESTGDGGAGEFVDDVVTEACGHMTDGPSATGEVVRTNGDNPKTVNRDHTRVDLTLFDEGDGTFSGAVAFRADTRGTYIFYTSTDLEFEVQTSGMADLTIAEVNAVDCATIATEYVIDLDAGSYFLIFSRARQASTALVHELIDG